MSGTHIGHVTSLPYWSVEEMKNLILFLMLYSDDKSNDAQFWSEAGSFIQLQYNFDVLCRKCMQDLQGAAGAVLALASAPAIREMS